MNYDVCEVSNKRIFPTLGDAKEVLRKPKVPVISLDGRRVKRRMNKREEKRAYRCDHCGGYHLTSKENYNNGKNANKKKKF